MHSEFQELSAEYDKSNCCIYKKKSTWENANITAKYNQEWICTIDTIHISWKMSTEQSRAGGDRQAECVQKFNITCFLQNRLHLAKGRKCCLLPAYSLHLTQEMLAARLRLFGNNGQLADDFVPVARGLLAQRGFAQSHQLVLLVTDLWLWQLAHHISGILSV